jgi:hypothetical protein
MQLVTGYLRLRKTTFNVFMPRRFKEIILIAVFALGLGLRLGLGLGLYNLPVLLTNYLCTVNASRACVINFRLILLTLSSAATFGGT